MLALVVSSLASALPEEKNIHARALCRPRTVVVGGLVVVVGAIIVFAFLCIQV